MHAALEREREEQRRREKENKVSESFVHFVNRAGVTVLAISVLLRFHRRFGFQRTFRVAGEA